MKNLNLYRAYILLFKSKLFRWIIDAIQFRYQLEETYHNSMK